MTLREWIELNRYTQKYLAKKLGITSQHFCFIVNKKSFPHAKLGNKIVELTGGEVTFQDIYKIEEEI